MKSSTEQAPKHGGGQPRLHQRGHPGVFTAKGQGARPSAACGAAIGHLGSRGGLSVPGALLGGPSAALDPREGLSAGSHEDPEPEEEDKLSTCVTDGGRPSHLRRLGLCCRSSAQPFRPAKPSSHLTSSSKVSSPFIRQICIFTIE